MIRAKAIALLVSKAETTCMFENMQAHGLITPHFLNEESFALTAAMGLGGGQTPVLVKVYD